MRLFRLVCCWVFGSIYGEMVGAVEEWSGFKVSIAFTGFVFTAILVPKVADETYKLVLGRPRG